VQSRFPAGNPRVGIHARQVEKALALMRCHNNSVAKVGNLKTDCATGHIPPPFKSSLFAQRVFAPSVSTPIPASMSKRPNSDHHGQRPPPALRFRPLPAASPNTVPPARPPAGPTRPPPQPQPPPDARVRTLRISGIPPDVTEAGFKNYLKELLGYDGFILSMVTSQDHAVATVTPIEGETPDLLKCTPGNRISLDYPGAARCRLVVDCDFIGVTPLYSAEEPTVE
jgi:hypothetical protein